MKLFALAVVLVSSSAVAAPDTKACDKGNGKACIALGDRAAADKDDAGALGFYKQACALKVPRGCGAVASMVMFGLGTPADEAKGHELRDKACTMSDAPSCNDLGSDYADGEHGVSKNEAKAKTFYEKACTLKDGLGCFNLGNVYRVGEGVKADIKKALPLFQKSCDLNSAKGCTELAIIYYEGTVVPKSMVKATFLLEKGCKLGSDVACKNVEQLKKGQP
ncbi:MAG: tetratricopeptide repeat protein [Kofleriaceae bacterium]